MDWSNYRKSIDLKQIFYYNIKRDLKEAVRNENEIKKLKGLPIAKYGFEKNAPYVEYPDGRKVYAEEI